METSNDKTNEKPDRAASVEIIESQGLDRQATIKLLRKMDWHIIPFMSLIYLQAVPESLPSSLVANVSPDYVSSIAPTSAMPDWTTSSRISVSRASNTMTVSPSCSLSTSPPRSPVIS